MSDNENFGFGKFIPGFDFLQNLAKGASQALPQMPNLSNWIAPTLNPEELEKRIGELKAVHFWLDQNSKALGATIQALEVQRMTLATLKGMNFNMGELADALKLKTPDAAVLGGVPAEASKDRGDKPQDTAAATGAGATDGAARTKARRPKAAKSAGGTAGGVVDPLQWWGALTQQFQQIAATAMKEAAAQTTDVALATGTVAPKAGSKKTAASASAPRKSTKKRQAGNK